MNKHDFLAKLRKKLTDLPQDEVLERLNFFSEMIEDRIEEGLSEKEAVVSVGRVHEIAAQILSETSGESVLKNKDEKNRVKLLEIFLLILGSPLWLSLVLAAFAIVLSLYAVLWSLVVFIWAVFVSLAASSLGFALVGFKFIFSGFGLSGAALIGSGLILVGLSIFCYFASLYASKAVILLTKKIFLWISKFFVKKEVAK